MAEEMDVVPWFTEHLDSKLLHKLDKRYRAKRHTPMKVIEKDDERLEEERQVKGLFFDSQRLAEALTPMCDRATKEWGITWKFFESFNYLKYDPTDYYDWHVDNDLVPIQERKLTCVVALNDGFKGGHLQIQWPSPGDPWTIKLSPYEAVVFPSILTHRARRVKAGERRVIVAWANGKPYR